MTAKKRPRRVGQNRTGSRSAKPAGATPGPGSGRSRPRIQLSTTDYLQAETLAGFGLTNPQIAAVLDIAESTFLNRAASDSQLARALRRGKAKAEAMVGEALFKRATGKVATLLEVKNPDGSTTQVPVYDSPPDVGAIRWWEMTRANRSEKVQQRFADADGNLLPMRQYEIPDNGRGPDVIDVTPPEPRQLGPGGNGASGNGAGR